jgi:hypothetical protein
VIQRRPKRRCRHCEGRIKFLRRLSKAVFCTGAHEREFREQLEALGVERLRESARRLASALGRPEQP